MDLLTFIALVIGASNQAVKGVNLWKNDVEPTLPTHTDFSKFMNWTRFWEIKGIVPYMMENQSNYLNSNDDWWRARTFIDGFNKRRADMLNSSICYVMDESMSPMVPRYVRTVVYIYYL